MSPTAQVHLALRACCAIFRRGTHLKHNGVLHLAKECLKAWLHKVQDVEGKRVAMPALGCARAADKPALRVCSHSGARKPCELWQLSALPVTWLAAAALCIKAAAALLMVSSSLHDIAGKAVSTCGL